MEEKYLSIFGIPNKKLWNTEMRNKFVLPPESHPIITL